MPPSPCPHPLPVGTWVPRALPLRRQARLGGRASAICMPFFRTSGPAWTSIIVDSEAHPPGARHSAPPRHPPAAGPAIVRSPNLNLRVKVPSKVQFSGSARLIFFLLYHPQGPRTCAGLREAGWQREGMWPLSPVLSDDPTLAAGPTRTRIPSWPLAQAAQNGSLEERRRRLLLGPRWFSASVCNIRQNTPGVVSSDAVGI